MVLPIINRPVGLMVLSLIILFIEIQYKGDWSHESLLGYILGFYPRYWPSLDYFPIVPWVGAIALGGLMGHMFFKDMKRKYRFSTVPYKWIITLNKVGQKALWIYIIHIPLTFFLINFWVLWRN